MSKIKLSKETAMEVIKRTNETREQLKNNVRMMETNVNRNFEQIRDPSVKKYLQLQDTVKQNLGIMFEEMDNVVEYCKYIIRWIDEYNNDSES